MRDHFPQVRLIDLLNTDIYRTYLSQPERLRESIQVGELVVIDEIQKLPMLLDEYGKTID